MDPIMIKTAILEARCRAWGKLEPHWQTMKQLSPKQRRMVFAAPILLVLGIVVIVQLASGKSNGARRLERSSRNLNDINDSSDGEATGAIYIRWGRSACPDETDLVYEGVVGGSYYGHYGGGANYVCLPRNPIYDNQATVSLYATMYGAEYQSLNFVSGQVIEHQNVPCAVCQSQDRPSVLMVPGRNICCPGWHREYHGYLVAERVASGHVNNRVFECLDHEPQSLEAGYVNENGALMYPVRGFCGSLPCPQYENNKPLTCAVCTK